LGKECHFSFEIVAHEIEFASIVIRGMERGFGRWKGKNQPAMPGINGFEFKDVPKERTIRFCVFGIHQKVSAGYHFALREVPKMLSMEPFLQAFNKML